MKKCFIKGHSFIFYRRFYSFKDDVIDDKNRNGEIIESRCGRCGKWHLTQIYYEAKRCGDK